MATIKADIYFQVFQGGVRVDSVHLATTQNSVDELRDTLINQIKKAYPDLAKEDVTFNRKEFDKGHWYIEASTETHDFVLLISRI